MSIENFCLRYPADPEVRKTIMGIRLREHKEASPVVILAEQLIKEGREGIREILNKNNPGNVMFELDPRDFREIPEGDRGNLFQNFAAMVFGISVVSLERALINGEYDHEEFCERYNLATLSLQLLKAEVGDIKKQKLSQEQMSKMYSVVKQDKTFALFFEAEGIGAMPTMLRQFLADKGAIPIIRSSVLPLFKQRAKFLVST